MDMKKVKKIMNEETIKIKISSLINRLNYYNIYYIN